MKRLVKLVDSLDGVRFSDSADIILAQLGQSYALELPELKNKKQMKKCPIEENKK